MSDDPLIGRLIDGRFRIEQRLGAGGMGVVYKARQIHVDRVVALKVVRPERAADETAKKALLFEARAVSQLTSPHTVTLIDVGPLDDGVFLAMELLEGAPLSARLGAPLPWPEAVRIADPIALSLAEAHARGIVHRDLKPLNVFMARTPGHAEVVKVLDFGLAALTHGEEHVRGGTPRYMAPEVLAGAAPDPRADVYALGLILHEMIAGRHPFEDFHGDALIDAQQTATPPPIETDLPDGLRRLVQRCLAKHPRLRPRDGAALRRELRRAAGLPEEEEASDETLAARPAAEQETLATRPSTLSLQQLEATAEKRPSPWLLAVPALAVALLALGLKPEVQTARAGFTVAPLVLNVETEKAAAPPPPAEVSILVHTIPDGATVTVDGRAVGETPVSIRVAEGTTPRIGLSLPGYVPVEITADPKRSRIRHVFERFPPPVDPVQRRVDHYLD